MNQNFGPRQNIHNGSVQDFASAAQQARMLSIFKKLSCDCGCEEWDIRNVHTIKTNPLKPEEIAVEQKQKIACIKCHKFAVLAKAENGAQHWEFHEEA